MRVAVPSFTVTISPLRANSLQRSSLPPLRRMLIESYAEAED